MDEDEIELVINAVNNVSDDWVLSTSLSDIDNEIKNVIRELGVSEKRDLYLKKLDGYRLIREIDELSYGTYTKVIKQKSDAEIRIINAGFMTSLNETYSQEHRRARVIVKCRLGHYFSNYVFEECLFFQKITSDDKIIMGLVDFLQMEE